MHERTVRLARIGGLFTRKKDQPYGDYVHGWRAMEEALRAGKARAQVALRWSIQEGNVVFPKAGNPEHMRQNIDIFDFELTDDEMMRINALPQRPYYEVPEEPPAFVLVENDYAKQA